jgi:phthalate 4,5-cis-dihydrodiol dehydrogenase
MMDHPVVRLGLVGFGAAGQAFLPALDKHPGFKLVAIAEPLARLREGLQQRLNVVIYDNLDD